METLSLELPYPPSINNYFRKYHNRMVISRGGRLFRTRVCAVLSAAGVTPMRGALSLKIIAHPPDRRKRDIDNIQKPLLDALEKGRAFENDSQVKDLHIVMKHPVKDGRIEITLQTME